MKSKVRWSEQVESYLRIKAPDPRRELWHGIKNMATWDGREDLPRIRRLEGKLAGYWRLRVKDHRVIYREGSDQGQRVILFLYAAPRQSVYEAFEAILIDDLA